MSWSGQSWGPEQPRFLADLTGDGRPDIVGFGLDGVWASLNNGNGAFRAPNMVLSGFGLRTGWSVLRHPRFLADLTGDRRAEIVGFGDAGVWTARNNGDGTFQPMKFVLPDLGYNQGWRVEQHPRFVVDITGNGRADIVAFGDDGVWVALGEGDGTFQPPKLVLNQFNYNRGWRVDQNPRFLADTTGDGKADIIGFGNEGVWVALGNGDGTFQTPLLVLAEFDPNHGWDGSRHPRIVADVNGDHRADIVGFANFGVYTALSNGDATFTGPALMIPDLGYNQGWRIENHPRFAADVTGDGKADIVGFGDDGVWVAVAGGSGASMVLGEFAYNQGWRVALHPRYLADMNGDRRADIVGFGDSGVWVSLSNGDGTFQSANLVLADFGYHAGPVVETITIDFQTYDDNLNSDSVLHVFVKNRASDSWDSAGPGSFESNLQDYLDHDADWFGKNPYLGCAINANQGNAFDNNSTNHVNVNLRSRPIPFEELLLPQVHIHMLAESNDTWKFDYTLTITLDNGTTLPPFSSNINGLAGIVLNQDNRDYSGICAELRPIPPRVRPLTDAFLTKVTIEFHTHDDDKNADTGLGIHIVNRLSATETQDIVVATDVAQGERFPDSGDTYKRIELPLASPFIKLADMVLPVVFINIVAGEDKWIFDYRVTFEFGGGQPYSWTVSGVVLDQDHHKHMGVYNGRPFPKIFYPMAPIVQSGRERVKHVPLDFVGQKLQDLFNSRQTVDALYPILKLKLDSAEGFGDQIPPSFMDLQFITNNPPPPDGQPLDPNYRMGVKYAHGISELGQFITWFGVGVHLNDINLETMAITVNSGDNQTPLTIALRFETGGPTEVTGSTSIDIINLALTIRLTMRLDDTNKAIDVMGWVDDINGFQYTVAEQFGSVVIYNVTGMFLGEKLVNQQTDNPDRFRTDHIDKVLHLEFNTSSSTDPGDTIRKNLRDGIFAHLSSADSITKVTPRQAINAQFNSWLMGNVIASGNPELVQYPYWTWLTYSEVKDDILTLVYNTPVMGFDYRQPPDWQWKATPGSLANIDHIIVLLQENRSFDHMLGYLSLPFDKGGMNRKDVDGLKGGEFNMYNERKCPSFRFAAGDTIFSPGPPNDPERVAVQINGGKMDGFVQAQADECGPATAHRVMGYHTAENVPTYDSLARDFAICHRWFASHPGPTFPNRFYELTGRPNVDPWGAWEYTNSSPLIPVQTDTIFDYLSAAEPVVSWRNFEHFYCFLRFFERYTFDSENIVSYDDAVKGFAALARTGNLPSVSFIEPHYVDYPPDSFCDEPPSDIRNSQKFIRSLVETVVASPKWDKTLLIITYDEHGGFYDHVPPPDAAPVAPGMLTTTGVRVPCFVISPWVKSGSVFGSAALHFDHTSILKTIARRFMSTDLPYIGERYAAAHDLSEVLGNQMQPGPFRPFIPYTLVYRASKMCLDVPNGSSSAGTPIWQYTPNGGEAQHFRFEDAGSGFFRIRTLAGLYLTADALATPGPGGTTGIKQDRKYEPGPLLAHNPDLQRWRLVASAIIAVNPNDYTISCAAVPGKVLQPAGGSTASQAAIVLGDPASSHSPLVIPNPWTVTSPLLPPNGQFE